MASSSSSPSGPTGFHEVISNDHPIFKPEPNRYILYISYSCPWACRALLALKLKKLDDYVKVVPVDPVSNAERLWQFIPHVAVDPVINAKLLRDIYLLAAPNYAGRNSVPALFDAKSKQMVSNESAEIVRIFNTAFNNVIAKPSIDLSPLSMRTQIDDLIQWISEIYGKVFKAALGKSQEEYETNCLAVFAILDRVEEILSKNCFLAGDIVTEADILLFPAVLRFPIVYEPLFKANLKTLRNGTDYPNIFKWAQTIYQIPGVSETVKPDDMKRNYYVSMKDLNPSGFVPLYDGPDWSQPPATVAESNFAWFK